MMLIEDSFRVVMMLFLLMLSLHFFLLAYKTRNEHLDDMVVQRHFMEHAVGGLLLFLGAAVGSVWSIVHLLQPQDKGLPEGPFTVSLVLFSASFICFLLHMIKEQTPGHDFYFREVQCPRTNSANELKDDSN